MEMLYCRIIREVIGYYVMIKRECTYHHLVKVGCIVLILQLYCYYT